MRVQRQDSIISLGVEEPEQALADAAAAPGAERRHNRQTAAQQIVKEPRVGAGREDIAVAHSDGVASQGMHEVDCTQRDSFGGSWGVMKGIWNWEQTGEPRQSQAPQEEDIPVPVKATTVAVEAVVEPASQPPVTGVISCEGPTRAPTRSKPAVPLQVKQNSEALREWCLGLSRIEHRVRASSVARESSSSSARAEEEGERTPPVHRQDSVISLGAEDPDQPVADATAAICVEKVSLSPRQDSRPVVLQQPRETRVGAGREDAVVVHAEGFISAETGTEEADYRHPAGRESFGGSWGAKAHFGNVTMSPAEPQAEALEDETLAPAHEEAVQGVEEPAEGDPAGECMTPVASLIGGMQIQPELWLPPFSTPLSGANLELSEDGYTATRVRGSRQSVTVTSAPLTRHKHGLYFEVEVRETVDGWVGGLGIGVTHTVPQTLQRLPDKAWRIPRSFVVGYAGCAYLDGKEHAIQWRADALRAGDTIGLLITGDSRGDLLLFVNNVHVFTLQGSVLEHAGLQTEPLYPVLDVFAATKSVTLLPAAEPPALPSPWQRVMEGGSTAAPSTYDASSRVSRACEEAAGAVN